jgi:RimJ/RimL family protein N-acetyltransferase
VRLRDVTDADLDVFYAHQADAGASALADVPSRDREAFDAHWKRIRNDPETLILTVDLDGEVAGNVLTFVRDDERVVGYWLGREFWGRGIASAALAAFLEIVTERPLRATVSPGNPASARVLQKNGFRLLREEPESLSFELR